MMKRLRGCFLNHIRTVYSSTCQLQITSRHAVAEVTVAAEWEMSWTTGLW